jgi:predicted amidophosphoribosyltransferase
MKINHMVCPNCGHDFYVEEAWARCDACGRVFYASESGTCNPSFNPVFTQHLSVNFAANEDASEL